MQLGSEVRREDGSLISTDDINEKGPRQEAWAFLIPQAEAYFFDSSCFLIRSSWICEGTLS